MLKVESPIILEHTLSKRTLNILRTKVMQSSASILGAPRGWILGDNALPTDIQAYIDKKLHPLGYKLYVHPKRGGAKNALLAYKFVQLHEDKTTLGFDHSTVFIPFDVPGEAHFINYGGDGKAHDLIMKEGDIVIFDQNKLHTIAFRDDTVTTKYGLSLFLDKINSPVTPTRQDSPHSLPETV